MPNLDLSNVAAALRAARADAKPIDAQTQDLAQPHNLIKPFVELELAFVLEGNLKGPNVTVADVINAIDYAVPDIEIIDSRVKDWAISLPDTLADNGSTGGIIIEGTPWTLGDLTLSNIRGNLKFNGEEVMSGNTKNVLGNALSAVAWLVNRLAQ